MYRVAKMKLMFNHQQVRTLGARAKAEKKARAEADGTTVVDDDEGEEEGKGGGKEDGGEEGIEGIIQRGGGR